MKIIPSNLHDLQWCYRYKSYQRRNWSEDTASSYATISAFIAVYTPILGVICVALIAILGHFDIHINFTFATLVIVMPFYVYDYRKRKVYQAVADSMNSPSPWYYVPMVSYLISFTVPIFLAMSFHSTSGFVLLILTVIIMPISVFVAEYWATGKVRQLQAAHAAEHHGKPTAPKAAT